MPPPRIMPARWFVGSGGSREVTGLLTSIGLYDRPLAEGERWCASFILPPFQRPPAWTISQKQLLIESVYAGLPIGALVINSTRNGQECDGWLLDGQQRMTALMEYTRGDFNVCGWYYPDLPEIEQRHFRRLRWARHEFGRYVLMLGGAELGTVHNIPAGRAVWKMGGQRGQLAPFPEAARAALIDVVRRAMGGGE